MNEVVALLADAASFRSVEALSIRTGALAIAKSVFSRGGRLLLYADAPTVALLTVAATEYRTVQAVETLERRVAPLIVLGGPRADLVEDRLFGGAGQTEQEDLAALERFGVVENVAAVTERAVTEAYARYSPVAVFLLGRGQRLSTSAEEAADHHRRTQVPLYSTAVVPWTEGWTRIDEEPVSLEWTPTLEGRPLQGEDAELAAIADGDARTAVSVEVIINRLLPGTSRQ